MKYAIIRLNGRQYKVQEGDTLLVDHLTNGSPEVDVLLYKDEGKVKVGTPKVDKVPVKLEVVDEEVKGTKLHIRKYKSKSRYRKHVGFRPKFSRIRIEKLG